jgi:uncharacterized protein DUF4872
MPADKDFKRLVRARMGRTGESYTTARSHLRPDSDPGRPDRFRGRHPDTAALTRLLAALGVTDPAGGRPVVATVDGARLASRAVPRELPGMTPQDVLVELRDGEPVLWDLAPVPVPVTWAELAEARAGVRSARHRLVVADAPADFGDGVGSSTSEVDLPGAAAAGIADTWTGMLDPPMRNFGVPGLAKWADLLTAPRDPKGWPRLLAAPGRQLQLLTWLYDWVETAGTGGGFFRSMYAEFLEEAAGPLGRPGLTTLAGSYRELATAWTTLAETARDAAGPQPLDPDTLTALLAGLRDQVLDLAEAERQAATELKEPR